MRTPLLAFSLLLTVSLAACEHAGKNSERPPATEAQPQTRPPETQPTPAPTPPPATETQTAPTSGACRTDEDCGEGKVCETCGNAPSECVGGCHRDDQCAKGERCNQVQCIRCPCPGQCEAI